MFQNCGKDGDCYVGIRSVRITIYLLHSQFQCTYFLHCQFQYNYYTVNSYILIILTAQAIPIYLLHSQFQCTYLLQSIPMHLLLTQSIPIYLLHSQFQYTYYTYCTVNSNLLIAQSIPIYLLHSQFLFTYLLHSQFQSCPFPLAICWAFVLIIVNSLCVAFCYQRFVQGCGILLLLTFTFSKTFKK